MTPNEYQALANRTAPHDLETIIGRVDPQIIELFHAILGLTTELGEFVDPLKRHIFYGVPLDKKMHVNLEEELGDACWYIALACKALNIDLEQVMGKNIAKLQVRFPTCFLESDAKTRDLDAEYKALEQ